MARKINYRDVKMYYHIISNKTTKYFSTPKTYMHDYTDIVNKGKQQ